MNASKQEILKDWSLFFLMVGVSSILGSVCHGAHDQYGLIFLNITLFLMNAISLISIYFFYRAAFLFFNLNKPETNFFYNYLVIVWIVISLVITLFLNKFLLIKINAGIILIYSLIIHSITYRNKQKGSGYIVIGILISFFSIIVHSLKLSFNEWFNYKDIAHLIMLISLVILFSGVKAIQKSSFTD